MKYWILFFLACSSATHAKKNEQQPSSGQAGLFKSLDPLSLSQNLSFYELYPESKEGKEALHRVRTILGIPPKTSLTLPTLDIQAVVSLITRQSHDPTTVLTEEQIKLVEKISQTLEHKHLKGSSIWSKKELLSLPAEEIDISRGLLIYQFDEDQAQIRQYEATINLMALQIKARLPHLASPEQMIREINHFIFYEMRFRFPPHSIHAKDIDLYTFLPSVLDSRKGVCLGVSILYLSLAQRLGLKLEIVTPPGHIFLRYRGDHRVLNIETTARGIHVPSEYYLGVNTRLLQERNIKEVIGLAFVNQASVVWGKGDYQSTVELYEKARLFLPDDPLLKMFLGMNYLFLDRVKEGTELMKDIRGFTLADAVSPETIPEDFLLGKASVEGLKAIFLTVDETRESIQEKQKILQKVIEQTPRFRAGLLQLATAWLQLSRPAEALEILQRYHAIDPTNPIVEYYLSILSTQRLDYKQAWLHLRKAEKIAEAKHHHPKALRGLKQQLRLLSPDPTLFKS